MGFCQPTPPIVKLIYYRKDTEMNQDDKHYEFYANAVNVLTSVYDVTLGFRTQSPVFLEEGKPPMIEVSGTCNIRMSPQHAKSLAALLVKQIIEYEDREKVKLPLPPDIQKFWDQCVKKG